MTSRAAWTHAVSFLVAIPLTLLVMELAMRGARLAQMAYATVRTGDASLLVPLYQPDPLLGWAPRPLLHKPQVVKQSLQGRRYLASYETDRWGIRRILGNDTDRRPQPQRDVLVIGDSYTGDFYASNDDMWYASLQKRYPDRYRVFAYGASGSGTGQQYLAFRTLQSIVQPHILVIQHCDNDVVNDHLPSSHYSIVRNQDLVRPYVINGQVRYRVDLWARLYRVFNEYSHFFRFIDGKLQVVQFRLHYGYSTDPQQTQALMPEAIDNWRQIYRTYVHAARAAGVSEVWSVSCGSRLAGDHPVMRAWRDTSQELGVTTFEDFGDAIYTGRQQGLDIFVPDGSHLNDRGNAVAGAAFVQGLEKRGLITP